MITTSLMTPWKLPNPVKSPFLARLDAAAEIPVRLVTTALDTALLGISNSLNILTLGKIKTIDNWNAYQGQPTFLLISELFFLTLHFINPKAQIIDHSLTKLENTPEVKKQPGIAYGNLGVIFEIVNKFLLEKIKNMRESTSIFKSQVLIRVTYAIAIPALTVCKVADFAIGILAAIGAFISLGTSKTLNTLAYVELSVTGLIPIIPELITKVINPYAGIFPEVKKVGHNRAKITVSIQNGQPDN